MKANRENKSGDLKRLSEHVKLSCNIIIDDIFENYHTYKSKFDNVEFGDHLKHPEILSESNFRTTKQKVNTSLVDTSNFALSFDY